MKFSSVPSSSIISIANSLIFWSMVALTRTSW